MLQPDLVYQRFRETTKQLLRRWAVACCLLFHWIEVPGSTVNAGNFLQAVDPRKIDFKLDIQPILSKHCYECHGPSTRMNGLRLDHRKSALAGGYSGPVINPGHSSESKLIRLVTGVTKDKTMPPVGDRLSPGQIDLLRTWIDQGAQWPEETSISTDQVEIATPRSNHWAFVAPEQPDVPVVRNRAWIRNSIDAFVLGRLEAEGLTPSPEAERVTLIRRLSLDLIGLPPTPKEVSDYLTDSRSNAYEYLVDRLLASPHYGEKWARHWLDLARYADTDGYYDAVRPHAWRYRHWVIDALNRNMPFDQFTIEQMAGDLLPGSTVEQKVATGFHRNTMTNREDGVNKEEFRIEQVIDRASTVGTVWLGLTLGCARCHDHKYDPISQKEFYQLCAFFDQAIEVNIEAPLSGEIGPYLQRKPEHDRKRKELLAEYKVAEFQTEWEKTILEAANNPSAELVWALAWRRVGLNFDGGQEILRISPLKRTQKQKDRLTDYFIGAYASVVGKQRYTEVKFEELREKLEKLADQYPQLSEAQTLAENPAPPTTHILIRGEFRQPGIEVHAATPGVLPPLSPGPKPSRLDLARWIVSKENPLTARVTVNRMWQEFFGRGLVETSDNLGTRGDFPTHPELLDWLATEFIGNGWNVKQMHKLIVRSATYRQSAKMRKILQERDPDNKLLARQSRLRLPAELVRDVTLSASGLLHTAVGGKSVQPPSPPVEEDQRGGYVWKDSDGVDRYRRGLYTLFRRAAPYPQLVTFDAPDGQQSCSRRGRSTTPLQALNLLNDPVFLEAAQSLAVRVLREKPGSINERIEYAFRVCLGREPSQRETDSLVKYFKRQQEIFKRDPTPVNVLFPANSLDSIDPAGGAVWTAVSSVLLNLAEFITRE